MAASGGETDNVVIIGVDFGTTYSGVAYTWSKNTDNIEVISSWDAELPSNSDEDKTPTAISFGPKNKVSWGYNIPPGSAQAQWFKLLLVDDQDLPDDVRRSAKIWDARAYLAKHNTTTIEVIALFLRHLWNHAIQRITESVSRNLVNFSKFHIVITLPAICLSTPSCFFLGKRLRPRQHS
jgi:molecular chaperone DnaK (HSP70)